MIAKFKRKYIEQYYLPKWYSVFFNEFLISRYNIAKGIGLLANSMGGNLLDIGCGIKPYEKLFAVQSYTGLEIDEVPARNRRVADYYYDGLKFPFPDNSFDSILCSQVLEHVFNPAEFLQEVMRVLKPHGKILISIPFVWDEHEQPHDFARYSSFGLRFLLESNGFILLRHEKLGANASTLFQLVNVYLYKISLKWPRLVRYGLRVTVMAFFSCAGLVAGWILPRNPDLYLDQIVLAEKAK